MPKIDKVILFILMLIVLGFTITQFGIVLKVISIIIGILYFLFIGFHLALCTPLILIVLESWSFMNKFSKIKNISNIIHWFVCIIGVVIAILSIYLGIPYLAAMLWNSSIDINEATKLLREL